MFICYQYCWYQLFTVSARGVVIPVVVILSHTDVVVLSSPDDDDTVFTTGLEITVDGAVPRGRVKSRQQQMNDLEDLSQLAEQVLE